MSGHQLPVFAIQPTQRCRHEPGDQALAAQNAPRALSQGNITIVAGSQTALAIQFPVGNGQRQNRVSGAQRRLQQSGVEVQQTPPIGRRAFGENGHVTPLVKQSGNLLIDDLGVPAAATPQKNGIVLRSQPTDQRPVPNLRLGDEGGRQGGIDHINVDPRNVVGHDQCARNRMRQISLDLDAERIKQRASPTCFQSQPSSIAADRKNQPRDDHTAENQQDQAKNPEGAKRKIGFVQSACPR